MPPVLSRLRWQLTVSHLVAIAFTLVSMVVALVLISTLWLAHNSDPTTQPADDARVVASAVQGLVLAAELREPTGGSASRGTKLSEVLRLVASGDLRVLSGPASAAPDAVRRYAPLGSTLTNVAYLAVVGPDGRVLGSSDPAGAAFAPPEQAEWTPLVNAGLAGEQDPGRLVAVRDGALPAALGAYPVMDQSGRPVAAVLLATTELPAGSGGFGNFWHALAFFTAATVVVLAGAFFFALASSSLVGYVLARRLVGRLERLGRAAEALAAGDLSRRVEVDGDSDEVGQLAHRFNHMADQLADTVAELAAAKQRAEAALHAKRELVANVSHELRTPLASIRGHTESLQLRGSDLDAETRCAYLEIIYRESKQPRRMINDLFAL